MATTDIIRKTCFIIGSDILLVFADQASPGSMIRPAARKKSAKAPVGEIINNKLYLKGIDRTDAVGAQNRCNYIAFSGILQPKQQGDRM
jgi:hypothetical protein